MHWVLPVNLPAKVARLEQITAVLLAATCFVFTAHVFTCSDDHRLSCWTRQQKSNEFGNTSLGRYWSMSLPESEKKGNPWKNKTDFTGLLTSLESCKGRAVIPARQHCNDSQFEKVAWSTGSWKSLEKPYFCLCV